MSHQLNDSYVKNGLVFTLPGIVYQVKLSLLLLKQALAKEYQFKIAVEREAAGKFDDLEIQILNSNKHRFYQLKHVEKEHKNKITMADLENEKNGRYSVLKYFMSFRKINESAEPHGCMTSEFVIFTNAPIEANLRKNFENAGEDDILQFGIFNPKKTPELLKFKTDSDLRKSLIERLKKNSNLEQLKLKLCDCIQHDKVIDFKDPLLKIYQQTLLKTVFHEDETQFKSEFVDNDSNLSDGAKAIRAHLEAEVENVFKKKLKIQKSINLWAGDETSPKMVELPSGTIKDEETNEFLDKLVLAVSQPNEVELGVIIENAFGEDSDFNLIDNSFVANQVLIDMINRTKERDGTWLTQDIGRDMFKVVREKLSKLYLVGPTLNHCNSLKSHNLLFQEKLEGLIKFLGAKDEQYFCVINTHNVIFSSLKVYETLKESSAYSADDSFIFVPLETLLRLRNRALEALQQSDLLVVELPDVHCNDKFLKKILDSITVNKRKKIILIAADAQPQQKVEGVFQCIDNANRMVDLTQKSQETFTKNIFLQFQGHKVPMDQLINDSLKYLIGPDIFLRLMNNEEIDVGDRLQDLGEVQKYYVPRVIKEIKISPDIHNSEFKILDSYDETDNTCAHQNVLLVSNEEDQFNKLCSDQCANTNVHWLIKKQPNHYFWRKSNGLNLATLRNYVSTEKPKDKINFAKLRNKVYILAAQPGMGKSTELTSLAMKLKTQAPLTWVLRINLVECSELFYKQKRKKIDLKGVLRFLHKWLSIKKKLRIDGIDLLEEKLFDQYFNSGKVIILFDGFDEICPNYKDKVIGLLKTLKQTSIERIWVTTRPFGILTELEDELMTLSHTLEPLTSNDIKKILVTFWEDNPRAKEYAGVLIKRFAKSTNDVLATFLGNPLNVKICATVFRNAFGPEKNKLLSYVETETSEEIDLAELYYEFFTLLFDDVFIKEKVRGLHDHRYEVASSDIIEEKREESYQIHQKMAIYKLFGENEFNKLLPGEFQDLEDGIERVDSGRYKMGIIERIVDNRPAFVHRTYAEYFAAVWFSDDDNWEIPYLKNFLTNIVFTNKTLIVKEFLIFLLLKNEKFIEHYPIHCKVLQNDSKGLEELLKTKNPANLKIKDKLLDWTPFQYAVQFEFWPIAELLLQCGNEIVGIVAFPQDFIMVAIEKGLLRVIKYLVEILKVNLGIDNEFLETPLHIAAKTKNFEILVYLLTLNKINKNAKNTNQQTILHIAVQNNDLRMVQHLVEVAKCDTELKTIGSERSPLQLAVILNNISIVKYFIENEKCDVHKQDSEGKTLLHYAILFGDIEILRYLMEKNQIDLTRLNKSGDTAFHAAIEFNNIDAVKFLVQSAPNVLNIRDRDGNSALHLAVNFSFATVKYLFESGNFHTDVLNKNGETLLHAAVKNYDLNIVEYLVDVVDVMDDMKNSKDIFGRTPLHKAVLSKKNKLIKYFVEIVQCDVNTRCQYGNSLLHAAAWCQDLDMFKYLTETGSIDRNLQDNDGNTALHIAILSHSPEIAKYLLEFGDTDLNIRNNHGDTALHWAVLVSLPDVVIGILKTERANTSIRNNNGDTLLHYAAKAVLHEFTEFFPTMFLMIKDLHLENKPARCSFIVECLVETAKIEVDARNNCGETALHVAVAVRDAETLVCLVERGNADSSIMSKDGETVLQLASKCTDLDSLVVDYIIDLANRGLAPVRYVALDYFVSTSEDIIAILDSNLTKENLTRKNGF